jgi:SagB-type dehydrogenase family enzyme
MKIRMIILISALLAAFPIIFICAEEAKPVKLPDPKMEGGKTLMQALKDRKSTRTFDTKEIPLEVLSELLWAADGINRPDSERHNRTAPSAMDMEEIDIYVAKADGLYLYDAKANALIQILPDDIRAATGGQPFVKEAPINLIYVADLSRMSKLSDEDKTFYSATDTGFISQNVYLYCASAGLNTVVRAMIDRPALAKAMNLRDDQKIILAQTVGYPKAQE